MPKLPKITGNKNQLKGAIRQGQQQLNNEAKSVNQRTMKAQYDILKSQLNTAQKDA